MQHPFKPVYNEESKVLILGSFPSVVSRKQNFYYANQQNRFWKVMEVLFGEEIVDKRKFCLKHHIALWDVIKECEIDQSADSSIRNVKVNDFKRIVDQSKIDCIFLTGKKALSLYERYVESDLEYHGLPSTSSANARMCLDDLVKAYSLILEKL